MINLPQIYPFPHLISSKSPILLASEGCAFGTRPHVTERPPYRNPPPNKVGVSTQGTIRRQSKIWCN
ncbi:Uncharacterized protein HZ326_8323 [Fusarium oxysporum f. sp. albedinis]|nr:Uncharacterized protein HZ326_8323 [Fusarium oxysporum f. sp. albedinis]